MEKKGVFIIPYYGSFKNYHKFFLESCGHNPDYDWLFITDNKEDYDYPTNVKKITLPFSELVRLVQSKFSTQVELKYAYKLCDLRPMYGYIFEDYIKSYQFWGHCDTDMIFGRISDFITNDDLDTYDKIGKLGHFTMYRNCKRINEAFKLPLNGKNRYVEVLTNPNNCSFDEEHNKSINNIFESYHFSIMPKTFEAGLYTKTSNFRLNFLNDDWTYSIEKKKKNIFIWDNGKLKRYVLNQGVLEMQEYLYIHFQSRKMKVRNNNKDTFKIIPNSFDDLEFDEITPSHFPKSKHFNFHYFTLRTYNLFVKVKRLVNKVFYNAN
ncbi:DUF6625 family protein [Lactiplantibacillus plantarum]|uniref:DUF6625 family protein n=1 Tax=Lactiplantibacillus plantarum TaxID=1590 RepID=UPI000E08DB9A|nr:DUF6625 family protein [Lactiplantibacillus plantarum]RDF94763.1 hypothetical protein DQM15_13985 [Lactiplantibacillus plantarum]WQE70370.1 DUF6625 family protein [Lactiplantibacillus plantarum]